jgi:hypothetical protein
MSQLDHLKLGDYGEDLDGKPFFSDSIFQHDNKLGVGGAMAQEELLAEIRRNRLFVPPEPDGVGTSTHKWKIRYSRVASSDPHPTGIDTARLWRIYVGSGCVNDEIACIQYLRTGDPRGWQMPANYGPFQSLARLYGKDYPFVDRPLYETSNPPHVLLTAPDTGEQDLGGFVALSPLQRPPFFRTAAMWELNLYRAAVLVNQAPFRSDPASLNLAIGGAQPIRWRIQAGKVPAQVSGAGVSATSYALLARLYLTRKPGHPESDRLYIEQLCFWPLFSRSAINQSLLDLAGAVAQTAAGTDLAVLGLGVGGLILGEGLIGIEEGLTNLLLSQLDDIAASTSSVEFWN